MANGTNTQLNYSQRTILRNNVDSDHTRNHFKAELCMVLETSLRCTIKAGGFILPKFSSSSLNHLLYLAKASCKFHQR